MSLDSFEKSNNSEPSEEDIKILMKEKNLSYYNAREQLRDEIYRDHFNKPQGMDWGIFWKTF